MVNICVWIASGLMALKLICVLTIVNIPPLHLVVYFLLTTFMLVSYAGTVFILPSFPVSVLEDEGDNNNNDEQEARYCEKCDRIKPDAYHHCSVCSRCVSHMDHHCPWTGNCVGLRTKKLFLLFLFYTSLSCLWFAYCVTFQQLGPTGNFLWFTVVLATLIGWLLFGYFWFHIYLLAVGRTTLDFMAHRPGNSDGFRRNLETYFGLNWWAYWIPVVPASLWQERMPLVDSSA
ncbi:unnamed protein product [Aphanomyces euteiches]|nr:hypothetical protein AeRB84_004205 [Aphanomyces euteiches]